MMFFDQQSSKRWQSALFLIAFVGVLLAMALLIHIAIASLSILLAQGGSFAHPSKPAIVMIAIVWFMMIAGGVFRFMDVRAGSAVLARRFGAVHASDRSRHEKEKQLLNVVAEVSIASSTAQPDVYVLRHDENINAFVLGSPDSRPVIVVTKGALDAFDRDQLQAVVAHEFAHITSNDIPLNMQLLIAMGALMAIDEVGRVVLARGVTDSFHPGTVLGKLLRALGTVGVFAGGLVSAAFSRQHEYLADACAVQFTRNPFALASALDVISERQSESGLRGVHARELSHLCFQSGVRRGFLSRLLATHPDLSLRIKAIEPHFEVKKRKLRIKRQFDANRGPAETTTPLSSLNPWNIDGNTSSGNVVSITPNVASRPISDRVTLLLADESACMAAVFALFVPRFTPSSTHFFNALAFAFNDEFVANVKRVMQKVPDELAKDQLSIVTHATDVLNKSLSTGQRQKMTSRLEQLVSLNDRYYLMDYARVQLIRRKLNVEFPMVNSIADKLDGVAQARKAKRFDAMGSEFALLLSLMVESSGATATELDTQFQRVLKCYTQQSFVRRTGSETGIVKELEAAFQTLYVQPKTIRHAFVQHCVEIMEHDGYVMPSERSLLDLFAASLGCEELIAA